MLRGAVLRVPGALSGVLRREPLVAVRWVARPNWRLPSTQSAPPRVAYSVRTATTKRIAGSKETTTASQNALEAIILRPYQEEAIEACLAGLDRGLRRIGVSSPTGSGKTTMFMHLIPRIQPEYATTSTAVDDLERKQTLILVGSVELALQAEAAAQRILGDEYTVEVEQSKRVASGRADVTIATYQTLRDPDRLRKFHPANFKLVIVDEAHHAASMSYLRLLHHFDDDVKLPSNTGPYTTFDHGNKVPIIGFSATFTRHDTLALSSAFEEIVFHRDVRHMLDEGWLSPVSSTAVYADLDLDAVEQTSRGDYSTSSLAGHVNTPVVNELIVRTYLYRATSRRSTLVFAVNLQHVADLVAAFREAGVDARSVSSHTPPKDRRDTIAAFQSGEFPVLVNCEVLTEGTDIREIDCIILARPTRSKNLLAQMVGRGLRLSSATGKEDCYVIDIADNISRASGLIVSPTLFGLEEPNTEPEVPKAEPSEPQPCAAPTEGTIGTVKMVELSDPFAISSDSNILAKSSRNAWVACGQGRYILDLAGYGFMSVTSGNPWSVAFTARLPAEHIKRSPYRLRQEIAHADTLERALQTADQYVERLLSVQQRKIISRYAPWRNGFPSEKQIAFLLKFKSVQRHGGRFTILGRTVEADKLTAGMVASYICALQHGAKAVREKADRKLAAATKKEEKARLAAERNLALPTHDRT